MSVYTKNVQYTFSINGHDLCIELGGDIAGRILYVTEPNTGTDYIHAAGEAICVDGIWKWEGSQAFDSYGNVSADDILAFLNANPPPYGPAWD